ncbi:MAG: MarR family transcriptional regulator [Polyangiaceae bacterium]|nr:MarR family transcriptional regulator [Polyangiaceae bacterium]
MRMLWALAHALQSRSKRMEAELGVTGPQRLVLRILGRAPNVTAGALARAMCVHPSTLTGVLRRLESRGLLERKRDRRDGRRALLVLTAQGKKLDALQSGSVEAAVRRTMTRLDEAELDSARKVLTMLTDELGRTDR